MGQSDDPTLSCGQGEVWKGGCAEAAASFGKRIPFGQEAFFRFSKLLENPRSLLDGKQLPTLPGTERCADRAALPLLQGLCRVFLQVEN